MMPPKKSKAARAAPDDSGDTQHVGASTSQPDATQQPKDEEDDEDMPEVNIFKTQLLDGKRHRVAPVGKKMLDDWYVTVLLQ